MHVLLACRLKWFSTQRAFWNRIISKCNRSMRKVTRFCSLSIQRIVSFSFFLFLQICSPYFVIRIFHFLLFFLSVDKLSTIKFCSTNIVFAQFVEQYYCDIHSIWNTVEFHTTHRFKTSIRFTFGKIHPKIELIVLFRIR